MFLCRIKEQEQLPDIQSGFRTWRKGHAGGWCWYHKESLYGEKVYQSQAVLIFIKASVRAHVASSSAGNSCWRPQLMQRRTAPCNASHAGSSCALLTVVAVWDSQKGPGLNIPQPLSVWGCISKCLSRLENQVQILIVAPTHSGEGSPSTIQTIAEGLGYHSTSCWGTSSVH